MADRRPRVWVAQPLFDDTVAQLAAYCDVVATPVGVSERLSNVSMPALRHSAS